MTLTTLHSFFLWCSALDVGILLLWTVLFVFASDFLYRFHHKFFPMERAQHTELN